jgi:hypothetical protein
MRGRARCWRAAIVAACALLLSVPVSAVDTIVLPPYLDFVVFDILGATPARHVSIMAPGTTQPLDPKTSAIEEIQVGDVLATVVIRRPSPGTWTFHNLDATARVKVLSQQFFPRGVLLAPTAETPPRHHDRVIIRYRILDGQGQPLRERPAHPLQVDMTVATPAGRHVRLPMRRGRTGSDHIADAMRCDEVGRYWTEAVITALDDTGRPVRIFEDHWSSFAVEAADTRVSPKQDMNVSEGLAPKQSVALYTAGAIASVVIIFLIGRKHHVSGR